MRFIALPAMMLATAGSLWATAAVSQWWLISAVLFGLLSMLGCHDLLQGRHAVLRNYPVRVGGPDCTPRMTWPC